tara:strand:- start:87 stop:287 length:201 start_codon:yes stop_codon:yes gene_type:complete
MLYYFIFGFGFINAFYWYAARAKSSMYRGTMDGPQACVYMGVGTVFGGAIYGGILSGIAYGIISIL